MATTASAARMAGAAGPWLEGDAREAAEAWLERMGQASLARAEAGVLASRTLRRETFAAAPPSGGSGVTPMGVLDALVMEFLVMEGHKEAAAVFSEETCVPVRCNLDHVAQRAEMRRAVEVGDVAGAIEAAEGWAPQVLRSRPRLLFNLQRQRFVELLRQGKPFEALEFAQTVLAPLCERHPDFVPELARSMGLLAFENPEDAPDGADLMDFRSRMRIAGALNAALLGNEVHGSTESASTDPSSPAMMAGGDVKEVREEGEDDEDTAANTRLAGLLKLLLWMQVQLDSAGGHIPQSSCGRPAVLSGRAPRRQGRCGRTDPLARQGGKRWAGNGGGVGRGGGGGIGGIGGGWG